MCFQMLAKLSVAGDLSYNVLSNKKLIDLSSFYIYI